MTQFEAGLLEVKVHSARPSGDWLYEYCSLGKISTVTLHVPALEVTELTPVATPEMFVSAAFQREPFSNDTGDFAALCLASPTVFQWQTKSQVREGAGRREIT